MELTELKEILGEELYEQVSPKVAGIDNLVLVNKSNGQWIPKGRFEAERATIKELQSTIDGMTKDMEAQRVSFEKKMQSKTDEFNKKMSAAIVEHEEASKSFQSQIDKLTHDVSERDEKITGFSKSIKEKDGQISSLTKTVTEKDGIISSLHRNSKEQELIRASGARDVDVVLKLLDQSAVSENEDGTLSGVTEQIEALKKSNGYLFGQGHSPNGGYVPKTSDRKSADGGTADVNAAIRAAFGR